MTEKYVAPPSPERSSRRVESDPGRSNEVVRENRPESNKPSTEKVADLRHEVAEEALPASESQPKPQADSTRPAFLSRELKAEHFKKTMTQTRKRLSPAEATFSKVIHNPTVDKVSEVAGQTIGRPSALAGGGAFAAIGLIVISWYAKHDGFQLSGYEFTLLILIGMLVGIAVEFLGHTITRILNK